MKRGRYVIIIVALFCNTVFAQKATNNWYFGKRTALNFNQTPPQPLQNGLFSPVEGCASVSDENGNLLFYTNGLSIANKQHEIMRNGDGLLGHASSTDNTLIASLPETDSIYYVFTIGAASSSINALSYSVVNMNRENGLGEVVQKNNFVFDETYEKLAAVRHCNKKDLWITVKEWNSATYKTFLLTKDGLNPNPITSNMGVTIAGYANNAIGTLKFSSDGRKLVAVHSFENNIAQLMKFDNSTGVLSDEVLIYPNLVAGSALAVGSYGAAFSPDNNLLYLSARNISPERSVVYQFDVSSHDAGIIAASRYVVATHNEWDAGALQIGPDRKIYFTQWEAPGLSVISNPNVAGAGCNFLYNSLLFPSAAAMTYGLPNFIAGDLDSLYTPYNFSWKLLACNSFNIQFTANRTAGIDSIKWSMGDGNSYAIFNPQHTYQQAGTYLVTMEIFKQDCGAASERITQTVTVGRSLVGNSFLPVDVSYCGTVNYKIIPSITSDNYLWSTGATSSNITVENPGSYWLQITKDGCAYRDTINVLLNAAVQVSLGSDTTVCVNKPIRLQAAVTGTATYLWSNGSTANSIEINMPATYWVQVKNAGGCMASDTLKATWGDCDIYIPSAFTPNGDGINENFGLITGISSTIFTFYIYNRYGQLVFTTTDAFKKWDGKVKGKPSPNGIYVWMMTYKNKAGFIQTDKGTVNLIR